ncbi:MAG: xylulose kinase, partial [Microlunatus sp.]|nr:xylulose kinase [Microlunatus sp.]
MSLVAGVDSSTQSVKVVVCDADSGAVVRTGRASHPDGTEVTAAAWLDAYRKATADPALLKGVAAM